MVTRAAWSAPNSHGVCCQETQDFDTWSSGLLGVLLIPMVCGVKRHKSHVETEAELGVMWSQAKGCLAPLEAGVTNCHKLGGIK